MWTCGCKVYWQMGKQDKNTKDIKKTSIVGSQKNSLKPSSKLSELQQKLKAKLEGGRFRMLNGRVFPLTRILVVIFLFRKAIHQ